MSTDERRAELAMLVAEYTLLLVVGLVVLAGAGVYLTYTVQTAPDTETELRSQQVGTWTTDSEFQHSAVVQNDSAVFDEGDRLENRPLYFTRATPVLEGEYAVSYVGDVGVIEGTTSLAIVVRAVEEFDGEEFTHWEEREQLASDQLRLGSGASEQLGFELNVTEAVDRADEIERSLGASPGTTEVALEAVTEFEIENEGQTFVQERRETLQIQPSSGTYGVQSTVGGERTEDQTQRVEQEVPVEQSTLLRAGGPVLLLVGLLGLAVVGFVGYRDGFELDERTRELRAFERARDNHDEWISSGTVPERDDRTVVELESLEGLVDVAIDSSRRVIETESRYVVLADGVRYTYDPPTEGPEPDGHPAEGTDGGPNIGDDAGEES